MPQVILHHLFRSPGHNYFGHHGMPAGENGIEDCDEIELVTGRGIVGDRFFDFKPDYKGQITFFDHAVVEEVRIHADKPGLPASAFRRNVIIEGVDLNSLIGRRFRLGDILFEGTQECSPCYWMDAACGKPGIENLLKGRGGLRCRILEDGILKRSGSVPLQIEESAEA
ncbi:molybdenum cofactor biosysynthesis protein [Luteolibacter ambystomatis]|uniref:Molybdenum cofactor biosysynthesis protein n=1 Tax=Luteolibacter ambystomatis TaxID=2824561 RepID=A0A975PEX9_9BACT|nr:MOSC domain-containing protein [Luteolibacter ambystomatis]QUE51595.1 molybdenum cofactor biosysynthesis protein [Luteolibacter ambystomatis]